MTIDLNPILPALRRHAGERAPAECCGLAVVIKGRLRYVRCRNRAPDGELLFEIAPEDWAAAEDKGEIVAVCHSHVFAAPTPSMADLVGCEKSGLPWLIVNHPVGTHTVTMPSGYRAPLVGRPFVHGVLDCYSLARDYYREALGLELPDFARQDEWWIKGEDLYRQNFEACGFVRMGGGDFTALKPHDGLLMQVASPVPNHAAVVTPEGTILQHSYGRLSSRDIYGGYWRAATTHVLRHRSQL